MFCCRSTGSMLNHLIPSQPSTQTQTSNKGVSIFVCATWQEKKNPFDWSGQTARTRLGSFKGTDMVRTSWGPTEECYTCDPASQLTCPPSWPPPLLLQEQRIPILAFSSRPSMLMPCWRPFGIMSPNRRWEAQTIRLTRSELKCWHVAWAVAPLLF